MTAPTNRTPSTADTLREISQVHEFKPGSYYVIEFDLYKLSREDIYYLHQAMKKANIRVAFIGSRGGDALHPVPAIEVTDLVDIDRINSWGFNKPPVKSATSAKRSK